MDLMIDHKMKNVSTLKAIYKDNNGNREKDVIVSDKYILELILVALESPNTSLIL